MARSISIAELRHLVEGALLRFGAARHAAEFTDNADLLRVAARWEPSGITLEMEVSGAEIRIDGPDRWLRILSEEARGRQLENRRFELELQMVRPDAFIGIDPAIGDDQSIAVTMQRAQDEIMRVTGIRDIPSGHALTGRDILELQARARRQAMRVPRPDFLDYYAGTFEIPKPKESKADIRAKELFKRVAGKNAFKALNREGLAIKGSIGGQYVLHPKMTYCVERPKDGAKLCAVVPDVPLYDHLLGIKVMIENDEPTFLKTANVAGVPSIAGRVFADALFREFQRSSLFARL